MLIPSSHLFTCGQTQTSFRNTVLYGQDTETLHHKAQCLRFTHSTFVCTCCQVGLCSLAFCPQSTQRDQRYVYMYAETVTNGKNARNGAMPWNQKEWFINVTNFRDTFLITNKMTFGNRSLYCRMTMKETSNRVQFIFCDVLGVPGGECRTAQPLLSVLFLLFYFPGSGTVLQNRQGCSPPHLRLIFAFHSYDTKQYMKFITRTFITNV